MGNYIIAIYATFLQKQTGTDHQAYEQLQKRFKDIDRQINNIVSVISNTGSPALMNKLQELEQQRTQITYELSAVEHRQREQTLAGRQLAEIFHRAKEKLKQGTLESCREVVNTYVAQVIVYDDSIKISLRLTNGYHLEQSIKRDDVKSGM